MTSYFNGSDADAETILVAPGGLTSPYAFTQFNGNIPVATTVTGTGSPGVGAQVCLDGVTTNFTTCSTVTNTNYTVMQNAYGGTYTFFNQDRESYSARPGDSGGSNGLNGVEYGVTSTALNGGGATFTPIANVLADFGLVPLITQPGVPANWSLQVNRWDGKCMDTAYGATGNGTVVSGYPCNGAGSQQWTPVPNYNSSGGYFVYTFKRFAASTKCLDLNIAVGNNGTANGTPVQEWDCNGWEQSAVAAGHHERPRLLRGHLHA